MTPPVDSATMWCTFGLKYSEEDLGIGGNIIAAGFALVTPPAGSMKYSN